MSELVLERKRETKNMVNNQRASEAEYIGKGKAHRLYEFGVKVSLAVPHKEGFWEGIQACPGNPLDEHTLDDQLDRFERNIGRDPGMTFLDKHYKGQGVPEERSCVLNSETCKFCYALRCHLRKRAGITRETSPMKGDGLLNRDFSRACRMMGST